MNSMATTQRRKINCNMKEKEVNNRRKFAILGLFLLFLVSCDFRSSDYYFSKAEQLEAEDKYAEAISFWIKQL